MELLLVVIFTLCAVGNNIMLAEANIDITYDDLKKINASCYPRDSCDKARSEYSPGILTNYACSCGRLCSKLGSCCIDSPHRNILTPTIKPQCRTVEETSTTRGFYMVDRCEIGEKFNPMWGNLCQEEWKEDDNIMTLAPVTSLFTSMTYKNYFCFRCHETNNDYIFWNIELRSHFNDSALGAEYNAFEVTYDHDNKIWMATARDGNTSIPVKVKFKIPENIKSLVMSCEPDAISNCSDSWTDGNIQGMCSAYTAIMFIRRDGKILKYKNAHCALCNSEVLEDMMCEKLPVGEKSIHSSSTVSKTIPAQSEKKPFSFALLLDINHFGEEKDGKMKKCEKNFRWDPFHMKCRKIFCAPGYVFEDGKCLPRQEG